MGITDLTELVNKGEPVSQQEIDAAEAEHIENAYTDRSTRVEVEETYAVSREEIDAKYAKAVSTAEERRANAHARNLKKRTDALEKVGLNPNGSDPRGREQGVL
jgi:hypothetical protein